MEDSGLVLSFCSLRFSYLLQECIQLHSMVLRQKKSVFLELISVFRALYLNGSITV
ncbi:hypothetical protein BDZ97DRAFT_1793622 [Flammula alnicola]|nr:hypothetical protein BDZ97DRAFT_1793622 [Flammula alnicola]